MLERALHGLLATLVFGVLMLFAVSRSKRLSDILEAMADERLIFAGKLWVLWRVLGDQKD